VLPRGMTPAMAMGADYLPPPMPWIDPLKEATALRAQVRSGFRSAASVIAERGGRMYDTLEQIALERQWANDLGIVLDTDPKLVSSSGVAQDGAPQTSDEETE